MTITVSFECPGDARFDTQDQTNYTAKQLTHEFQTVWIDIEHEDHWHVVDTGIHV